MPDQPQALRILLVDDHEASARALARLLRHQGYLVTTAYTFAGALALAAPTTVDLLICDVDLPDGNGCDLLRRLRAFFGGRALPAIAVTGHEGLFDECRKAGYGRFLNKPLRLDDVLEAVRAITSPQFGAGPPAAGAPALGGVPSPDRSA
jgi:CheY-like chemotaxis protein